jgi:hemerythrin-like domain-containing protein
VARRHPALVPVARDHHECLILAQRLLRGSTASDRRWPAEPAAQAGLLADFFESHLRRHFAVEEQTVFPAARDMGADAANLVSQLAAEHRSMAGLVQGLATNTRVTAESLAAFGALLNAHVRLEDRTLFPLMEARLAPDALARLRDAVESLYR